MSHLHDADDVGRREVAERRRRGGQRRDQHRFDQALKLRGDRDFDRVVAWQAFVDATLTKSNGARSTPVAEESAAMREIHLAKLPEYVEDTVRVSDCSTIRLNDCAYSVTSRLIGEHVVAQLYEERLDVSHRGTLQLACERLRGRNVARLDYRNVLWSLMCKPGAFASRGGACLPSKVLRCVEASSQSAPTEQLRAPTTSTQSRWDILYRAEAEHGL